ncbi:hypothetical protein HYALB_00007765 [Hymenoscyphus albidus]|uniref:BTB domain-containing protein n=1 Tax=Hymenoscyphus albidus TaxID=595503 RepID=A0A9N9LPE5_9HELO|nr:hypothetical protein HYALB_00007765 [Hymenoscyphus albidus]
MDSETIAFDPDGDLMLILTHVEEEPGKFELVHTAEDGNLSDDDASMESPAPVLRSKETRMIVSSKHLIHVSSVFKAMFRNETFVEGRELAKGKAVVPLPDDDPFAMTILINLIHHNHRKVPRTVDLDTMTNIAILADKYELTEVLYTNSELWLKDLKKTVPVSLTQDLLPWLSIACVFNMAPEFKHLTRIATLESSGDLGLGESDEDLPIPAQVFAAIESERQRGISEMYAIIHHEIQKYQTGPVNCRTLTFLCPSDTKRLNYACDGAVLGTLLKSADENKLWPPVPPPFVGFTLRMVMRKAQALTITALCDHLELENESEYKGPSHGVKAAIVGTIKKIKGGLGLNIKNYKMG